MDDAALVLSVRDLTYRYPDGQPAIEGITFDVTAGERLGVLGANGAGKSTLLLHLNGVLEGDGHVRVAGMTLEKRNLKAVRRKVGLVFQNPDDQLFCPTVYEDVAFGPRHMGLAESEVRARVDEALAEVGMAGSEKRSAFHMSFGEKKRVAIATVLAMKPAILALDEPTSNLDPRGRREFAALLRALGGTQIIVTHDLDFARSHCTRALVLSHGRKVADGATGEILGNDALLGEHGLA